MLSDIWHWIIRLSLTQKLITVFVILITVPIVAISMISYSSYSKSIETNTALYVNQISQKILERVDQYVSDIKRVTGSQIYMQDIQESLANPNKTVEENNRLQNFVKGLNSLKNDTESVYIFDNYGNMYDSTKNDTIRADIRQQAVDLRQQVRNAQGSSIVISTQKMRMGQTDKYYFSIARELKNTNSLEGIGMIIFDSRIQVIADAVRELDAVTEGRTMVIDDQNTVIYDSEQKWISTNVAGNDLVQKAVGAQGSFKVTIEGKTYLTSYTTSEVTGWKQIVLIPVDHLTEETRVTRDFTMILVLLSITVALVTSAIIAIALTRPLRTLMRTMKQVNKENLDVQIPVKYSDEFGILAKHFNNMIRRINELVEEVYQTQNRKREAELRSLQHQINPHFIYNTLEVIRMTAEVKRDYEISEMTYNLGELLRYGILRGTDQVTIKKELDHLDKYLSLQNFRFSKDIQLAMNISQAHLNYPVIKLLFQPIVENAILHGFEMKEEDCLITISSYEDKQAIYFTVRDNGCGMEEGQLRIIRNAMLGVQQENRSNIGIANVNERIVLQYGAPFGLRVDSEIEVGTTVTIVLPILEAWKESA
ncbi:sensor histidine kinase [Paenibacillus qinlingensis]|uniref:Two-component system sensor histidine kinase YesM n=1 Tax=Paenibacillus qinlingensis TaxID=1837343 RepID=A0ABU1NUM1_9BACL|nr:sensor histidine kinase [Paenibacillus qinlingensis]MDR6551153.1 two-component system sensor histidine kinase YesM [Paenibacillus qinlingensis]